VGHGAKVPEIEGQDAGAVPLCAGDHRSVLMPGERRKWEMGVMARTDWKATFCHGVPRVESRATLPADSNGIANPVLSHGSQLQLTGLLAVMATNPLEWVSLTQLVISIAGTPAC